MSQFPLLILCSGFGKRMLDLTLNQPKPLLKVNNKTLLANTINFFRDIGCNEFFINSHYLHDKIQIFINDNFSNLNINLVYEPIILGTGGGIKNIFNYTNNKHICVVNCDIFWEDYNKLDISHFLKDLNKVDNCKILLSKEKKFHGLKKDKGDFSIQNEYISNWNKENEIIFFSGLQIVNKKIFEASKFIFPINDIWNKLIINKSLKGELSRSNILHIGDKNSFVKL